MFIQKRSLLFAFIRVFCCILLSVFDDAVPLHTMSDVSFMLVAHRSTSFNLLFWFRLARHQLFSGKIRLDKPAPNSRQTKLAASRLS